MCTAISYKAKDHYFGRNLDLEQSYRETVTVTPRNYPLDFQMGQYLKKGYALIGIAAVVNGYPLYYDATNEHGLSMAGLNFPGNAFYHAPKTDADNIPSYGFIPWVLRQCKTVKQCRPLLQKLNLTDTPFSKELPPSPLHWMISDAYESIVVEPGRNGIVIYDDPVGVLTNNPPFDFHLYNLSNYLNLTIEEPVNRFTNKVDLKPYSRGMGSMGLPGDLSSASRFVRAVFTKLNAVSGKNENESISQFFHILNTVSQTEGCVKVNEKFEKTVYTSCCNTDKGIYYYTTYYNRQITAISLDNVDRNSDRLHCFPLIQDQQIRYEN